MKKIIKSKSTAIILCIALMTIVFITIISQESASSTSANTPKWKNLVKKAPFPGRSAHTATVFKNKLWVIGGWKGNKVFNDIWSSKDGISWNCITKEAPFRARAAHGVIVFKKRMWLIGGLYFNKNKDIRDLNDIWYTDNGIKWIKVKTSDKFSPRGGHRLLVYKKQLWVIGGIATTADIWVSSDGIKWRNVVSQTEFSSRGGHSALVFNNKLWVIGGIYVDKENKFNSLSDVWTSKNGIKWTKATEETSFFAGGGHSASVYNNRIWVMGGFRKSGTIFATNDGTNWDKVDLSASFGERVAHTCTVFKGKMWVIGGYNGADHQNDIWFSDFK
jgi:hypothetical protein